MALPYLREHFSNLSARSRSTCVNLVSTYSRWPASIEPWRTRSDARRLIWLELAEVVSAWRGDGASDGNRTHVSCPVPLSESTTYRRWQLCV